MQRSPLRILSEGKDTPVSKVKIDSTGLRFLLDGRVHVDPDTFFPVIELNFSATTPLETVDGPRRFASVGLHLPREHAEKLRDLLNQHLEMTKE